MLTGQPDTVYKPKPDVRRAQWRTSDAEREAACQALGQMLAEGRLEPQEHEQRVAAVVRAQVHSELDAQLADLPVRLPRTQVAVMQPAQPAASQAQSMIWLRVMGLAAAATALVHRAVETGF